MDSKSVEDWKSIGSYIEVLGVQVFYIDTGNNSVSKPVLAYLHGYPSCSFDLNRLLKALSQSYRVIVHDHPGFGLSAKPEDYSYSLIEQAEIALGLYEVLGIRTLDLVAHDYGTSVATEIIVRIERGYDKLKVRSLSLCNGSVHIEMARLRLIQKLLKNSFLGPMAAKLSSRMIFLHQMKRLWYDPSKFNQEEWIICWQMLKTNNGRERIPTISKYIDERYKFWHRWIGGLKCIDMPVHILWAQNDPVAVREIGEALANEIPGATLSRMNECGHYPMSEKPEEWLRHLLNFLDGLS